MIGAVYRTYVLLGDGECQEGSVWEAAFVAARYGLEDLVAIVVHNRLQQYGWEGPTSDVRRPPQEPGELVAKWAAFGWRVLEVDGHDIAALLEAFAAAENGDGRPVAIVARTVKGKGVSFAEGRYLSHVKVPRVTPSSAGPWPTSASRLRRQGDDTADRAFDARGVRRDRHATGG